LHFHAKPAVDNPSVLLSQKMPSQPAELIRVYPGPIPKATPRPKIFLDAPGIACKGLSRKGKKTWQKNLKQKLSLHFGLAAINTKLNKPIQ
jgi:hypothetical protein